MLASDAIDRIVETHETDVGSVERSKSGCAAPLLGQLAVVEAIGGQLYLAILIARLVGV